MKRGLLFATLIFCLLPSSSQGAAAPDELYIKIFDTIMVGDGMKTAGQGRNALEKYLEADRDLKKLQSAYKTWNPRIVNFRLKYLSDRIGPLKVQYPGTIIPKKDVGAGKTKGGKKGKKVGGGVDSVMNQLNDRLVTTSQQNSTLRDQLREALSARSAASDPEAYAKAQGRIRELEQHSDVSTITIGQQGGDLKKLRDDYSDLQRRLAAMEARDKEPGYRAENQKLKAQLASLNRVTSKMPDVDELKRRVSLLETDLRNTESVNKNLSQQNEVLRSQMASTDVDKLRQNNAALQNQVAELNKIAGTIGRVEDFTQKLSLAEAELKAQKALNAELTTLNKNLETKVRNDELPRYKAENQALKGEIVKLTRVTGQMPSIEKLQNDLATAQAKVQAEQALRASLLKEKKKLETLLTDPNTQIGKGTADEVKALESEKKALEVQLKKLADEQRKSEQKFSRLDQQSAAQSARLKQLERERVELQKALEKALKDLDQRNSAATVPAPKPTPAPTVEVKKKVSR
jgi:chromosome segregation ATPase